MKDAYFNTITINSLKYPFSFNDDFVVLKKSDLESVFSAENSYKTKFYTILIAENGTGKVSIDSENYILSKNSVFFVDYNQIFRFSEVSNFKGEVLLFTKSFYNLIYTGNRKIRNDTAFSGLPSQQIFLAKEFIRFKNGIQEIIKEFSKPKALSQEIICLNLKIAMLKFIRNCGQSNEVNFRNNHKNSYLEQFKNLIEKNFKELKRTSEYANKLSITANYLNALVKEKLDISAENLIQNRVILEAERLLLNTDLSVTEISFELGFSDKSHFGKYFKRNAQISPNNFRKNYNTKL